MPGIVLRSLELKNIIERNSQSPAFMELTFQWEGPTLNDTLKKKVNDLKRESNTCFEKQKVEQNKRERRCR